MPRRGDGLVPLRLVGLEVSLRQEAAALIREREQRPADGARVGAGRALVGERFERRHEAGLLEPVARVQEPAARRVHPRALAHRHDRREHLET